MKQFVQCTWPAVLFVVGLASACDSDPESDDAAGAGSAGKGGASGKGGAQSNAGRGGTQIGTGGSNTSGGTSGTGGEGGMSAGEGGMSAGEGGLGGGGLGGEGGGFSYDEELCDCTLEDDWATCTITEAGFEANLAGFEAIFETAPSCNGNVNELERKECDDGTVRYRWLANLDQSYEVVRDAASNALIYGRAAPYQRLCIGGVYFEDVSYGTAPSAAASCDRTYYCCGDEDVCQDPGTGGVGGAAGLGGESGSGGAAPGGGGGRASEAGAGGS